MTEGNMGNSHEGCCGNDPRQHRHHSEDGKGCCGSEPAAGAAAGDQAHNGHDAHHGHHGGGHGGCCGHTAGHGHGRMHIPTAEERIARLEAYLQDLRAEAAMVEARLAELKAA